MIYVRVCYYAVQLVDAYLKSRGPGTEPWDIYGKDFWYITVDCGVLGSFSKIWFK